MRVQQAQVQKKKEKDKMKKLMIAAVVAAVAGGAFATDYVYDFSATLKTTKARSGKVTTTINLGADATGTMFWYEDPSVTNFLDTTKTVGGATVPTISDAQMATNKAAQDAVIALANYGTYNYKSAGKWCATWKFSWENCYRVTGSTKLTDVLSQADCCYDGAFAFSNIVGSIIQYQETATNSVAEPLFQHFGSLLNERANKIEIYAPVTLKAVGATSVVDVFGGWLAGQGTLAARNGNVYVSAISGNIVGTLPAPVCPNCCTAPTPSYAFDCANIAGAELPYTAGFGTFRLKINNRLSTF